jgi:hypothetical protein
VRTLSRSSRGRRCGIVRLLADTASTFVRSSVNDRWAYAGNEIPYEQQHFEDHYRTGLRDRCDITFEDCSWISMEYITASFENTAAGLRRKDDYTKQVAAQGYKIVSEQIEQGHIKGEEQCCWALICLPAIFLAGRTPGKIVVTYGRETTLTHKQIVHCNKCGAGNSATASFCEICGVGMQVQQTKKCPMCAETIQRDAKKCRFCGEILHDS